MGLRERKQEETRRRLAEAARDLFEEHGYDDTTVEMIAEVVGVSSRTFHRYFESKAGVVAEPGYRLVRRVVERLTPGLSTVDLIERLAVAVEEGLASGELEWSVRLHRENPLLIETAPLWHRRWARLLADGLAAVEGRRAPSLADRVRSTAALHLSALAGDEWMQRRPDSTFTEVAREITGILHADLDTDT